MSHPSASSRRSFDSSKQFLLQVDGLGCLLLLQQDEVLVGGNCHGNSVDVAIQSSGVTSPLAICRDGDRYLARSQSPFRVNGKSATSKLLFSGETLEIGRRARLRFYKPVAPSASAFLQLTGAGLQRSDVRCVVLLSESLLFGASSHFSIAKLCKPIVLTLNDGRFALRVLHAEVGSDHGRSSLVPLSLNEPTLFEGVHFALHPYDEHRKGFSHAEI